MDIKNKGAMIEQYQFVKSSNFYIDNPNISNDSCLLLNLTKTKKGLIVVKKDNKSDIRYLIENNYLDEQRYAEQFAGGRFRMKKWGRVKIKHALKQLQVSDYCIRKGMKVIDEEAYRTTLAKLLSEKQKTMRKETNIFLRKRKLTDYLLQKGYESELIRELLNEAKDESN
jgi:regulatory protein